MNLLVSSYLTDLIKTSYVIYKLTTFIKISLNSSKLIILFHPATNRFVGDYYKSRPERR